MNVYLPVDASIRQQIKLVMYVFRHDGRWWSNL